MVRCEASRAEAIPAMSKGTVGAWFARHRVESIAVLISLLLSLWVIYLDNVINSDGILYLTSAESFARGDWETAVEIYRWPLYAWLISVVQQASSVGIDSAAYVLNTLLYAVLVWSFIAIVRTFKANDRTLWLAALFVLALPSLNGYRSFVIRDIGFWAFYLLALLAFFKFQFQPTFARALAWGMAMVVATLFRIEGIVFLLLLPTVVLWRPQPDCKRALARFAQMQTVAFAGLLAATAWFSTAEAQRLSGRLFEPLLWLELFGKQLTSGLEEKAHLLAQHLLNTYSNDFAMPGVLVILLLILVTHVVKGLSLLGVMATGYAWFNSAMPLAADIRRSLMWLLALNVAVLIVFVTQQFFLTGRYVMALALTLALYVPFGLNRIYEQWHETRGREQARGKWLFPVAMLLVVFMVVDSLWSFGSSSRYLKDAGQWLRSNTATEARIYSTNAIVSFYAGKGSLDRKNQQAALEALTELKVLQEYDYLAIVVRRKQGIPDKLAAAPVIQSFSNERNDRVLIFKVSDLKAGS